MLVEVVISRVLLTAHLRSNERSAMFFVTGDDFVLPPLVCTHNVNTGVSFWVSFHSPQHVEREMLTGRIERLTACSRPVCYQGSHDVRDG